MPIRKTRLDRPAAEPAQEISAKRRGKARELALGHDRQLTVVKSGGDDLVEIRSGTGTLELRVRMTADGPVLQMESVRISLKAAEAVDVECGSFAVNARDSVDLKSGGGMRVSGEADVRVDATGEVHVKGKMIYLN